MQKNDGGMLIIDYGYADSKMHETLQAVNNHKYSNILENIGDSDITYNINFHSFEKFISQFEEINSIFTNQKKFLTSMGILQRAEIISKNIAFSKKADLFYRVRRLIDDKQMGELFKVMLIKNKKNTLYFDSGEPPVYEYSKDYQSGPLSFEYFYEGNKIITNCGYGRKISKKTQLISKFTSAQSTLCLNDTSVVKFQRNNLINKTFGSTISDGFKIYDIAREESKNDTFVAATHNAYLSKYGYLHRREIKVLKKNGDVNGVDTLIKKMTVPQGLRFGLRFHI